MNLSEGIRYCTMIPSIEAYGIGNHPTPAYSVEPPEIDTYTVAQFATDIVNGRIRVPFAPHQKMKTNSRERRIKRSRAGLSSDDEPSDGKLEEELMKKFDELFGSCDEE